jgi:hypothetical protein
MATMEVDVYDAYLLLTGTMGWIWAINWEYISLTVIPISSNAKVRLKDQYVSSDPASNRQINFALEEPSNATIACFATLTLPHDSVN